jgi:cell fate (sporulation/competence/biofilm development) regulator YlbF (YheA/YmcA/DUF963 family)
MPVDTQQLLDEAEKLGQLVAQHPAVDRYKQAQKSVAEDPDASRLLADFERQLAKLDQQAQAGLPVTDAQRDQLEALQGRIVSHIKVKALNMAQVDFIDLLRRITQTIQRPLSESPTGARGAATAPGGSSSGGGPKLTMPSGM